MRENKRALLGSAGLETVRHLKSNGYLTALDVGKPNPVTGGLPGSSRLGEGDPSYDDPGHAVLQATGPLLTC